MKKVKLVGVLFDLFHTYNQSKAEYRGMRDAVMGKAGGKQTELTSEQKSEVVDVLKNIQALLENPEESIEAVKAAIKELEA